jgi:AbrB family looped-hinge helix DNA binding protein
MSTLTMDKAGRFVLPKAVRDAHQLQPGDALEIESLQDRIVLRPRRGNKGLHKKQGIWVFSSGTGEPVSAETTDGILQEIRRERELSLLGNLAPKKSRLKGRR